MKTNIVTTLLLSTALITVVACSSVQPNHQILAAQDRLSAAYDDKNTADRGMSDLRSASTALQTAQTEWDAGNKDQAEHLLTMGGIYLDLADTRGRQASIEQDIAALKSQSQMQAVRTQAQMDDRRSQDRLADRDSQLADRDSQLAHAQESQRAGEARYEQSLADKDRELAQAREQLREYDMKVTELGSTLVLQDVSFAFGRAELREGASNRLQPLINYLKVSPETQVRIEGHTDGVGTETYNRQLSSDRATAVKDMLTTNGIDGNRIETLGSGHTKPVSNNDTESGRQANRRVEITLLR
jgi:outer membrane protein OmpA-like peptidoglycan-associated protein